MKKSKEIILPVFFGTLAIFFGLCFIRWTVGPYYQMTVWRSDMKAFIAGDDSRFPNDPAIYKGDSAAQERMRLDAFSSLFNQYINGTRTGYTPLYDQALARVKEWVDAHPYQFSHLLFLAKAYEYKANFSADPSYYDTAEAYYQKALALSPERQDLLYAYAEHLSNTGRKDEAVALLKGMLAKNPDIIQTKYYLGVVLAANDKKDYNEAIKYIEDAYSSSNGRVPFDPTVIKALYQHFFYYYYSQGDYERFRLSVYRLFNVDPSQKDEYQKIIDYLEKYHNIPAINIHE